jgi:hypothetical protein
MPKKQDFDWAKWSDQQVPKITIDSSELSEIVGFGYGYRFRARHKSRGDVVLKRLIVDSGAYSKDSLQVNVFLCDKN